MLFQSVSAPAFQHASVNSLASSGISPLTWAEDVFSDIHSPGSFLYWDAQLILHTGSDQQKPSLFSQALDVLTADAVQMCKHVSGTFRSSTPDAEAGISDPEDVPLQSENPSAEARPRSRPQEKVLKKMVQFARPLALA